LANPENIALEGTHHLNTPKSIGFLSAGGYYKHKLGEEQEALRGRGLASCYLLSLN
jgi:hypothetical protein